VYCNMLCDEREWMSCGFQITQAALPKRFTTIDEPLVSVSIDVMTADTTLVLYVSGRPNARFHRHTCWKPYENRNRELEGAAMAGVSRLRRSSQAACRELNCITSGDCNCGNGPYNAEKCSFV
jgi:hypothetical protein